MLGLLKARNLKENVSHIDQLGKEKKMNWMGSFLIC
jgi:hypothetical protein